MAALVGKVDMVDLLRDVKVTIQLQRKREMRWRLWIGLRLIALAARITGMGIVVEDSKEPPPQRRPHGAPDV